MELRSQLQILIHSTRSGTLGSSVHRYLKGVRAGEAKKESQPVVGSIQLQTNITPESSDFRNEIVLR